MHKLTQEDRRRGGLAVAQRQAPERCPVCGKKMAGRSWHSYLGHLGLHGLARRYFDGDLDATQRRLRRNGLARQDPMPANRAMPTYKPIWQS